MKEDDRGRPDRAVLGAALLLTGSLGSIHAFSIFIEPFEISLGRSRADISAIYSLALVCLTLAVLWGHHLFGRLRPGPLAALACLAAAGGLGLAALGDSYTLLIVGYGVLFGAANGVGYSFALLLGARAWPARKGLAMGGVTAAYALGATIFVKLFAVATAAFGTATTLASMAGLLCLVGCLCFLLLAPLGRDQAAAREADSDSPNDRPASRRLLIVFWLGYGFGTTAGLMAIGHAAGIAAAAGATAAGIVAGAMMIALGNALGGLLAGLLADRLAIRHLLIALPILSALALAFLALGTGASAAIAGLAAVGFTYGAIIAVTPVAVLRYVGSRAYSKAYGRVFTAWGLAGLAGPWLAGWLYDGSGDYGLALWLAAAAALVSVGATLALPREPGGSI